MTTASPAAASAPRPWLYWPGWRHLPRDARDTLFLLAVIGWTILPHVAHLPWWTAPLVALVLFWRARLALVNAPLPGRWALSAVLLTTVGLTLLSEHTLLGKEAGVTMLVMLMVLKTLELRARRDALVVFFLGFFLVLTNFLYSQSLAVAGAMIVSVWGLLTALVLAHMPVGQPSLRQAGILSARAAVLGAPIMVVLFLLFPRIGPLWGLPEDAAAKTGLSGTLKMGGVAELANDDSVAMRLRFPAGPPPGPALYFRGPVLTVFDGIEWRRRLSDAFPNADDELHVEGPSIEYEVTLEPSRVTVLPLLDVTPAATEAQEQLPGWRLRRGSDLAWTADRPITERLRFTTHAWTRFRIGPFRPRAELTDALRLPVGYNPRMAAWAASLRADPQYARAPADVLAGHLLDHIRTGGYTYTLAPGTYGRNAVDEFWFDRKEGFCEHFAASFVVAMRLLGVPARIVTGYQGIDTQPVDGYWIVRQSHAHAWAEYWQAGRGWVRVDPTAAVAPDRIVRSLPLVPRPGFVAGAIDSVNPALLKRLRGLWEATNNRWNQWVLGYSRHDQFNLLQRLGVQSPNWSDLAMLLIGLFSSAALAGAGWAWWDKHRRDPWERLLSRVRARLLRLGVRTAAHEPPRTLATRARHALGPRGAAVADELEALDRLRYGRQAVRLPPRRWWRDFARSAEAAKPRGA